MAYINQLLQNRYRITNTLRNGSMGAVYMAWHVNLDKVCVVKEMYLPNNSDQMELLEKQFEREGRIIIGFEHPNLPKVMDYFKENGHYYLV